MSSLKGIQVEDVMESNEWTIGWSRRISLRKKKKDLRYDLEAKMSHPGEEWKEMRAGTGFRLGWAVRPR